jgi:hypothetical protein
MILVGGADMTTEANRLLGSAFMIKDMGPAEYFLGLEIFCTDSGVLCVGQTRYALDRIDQYEMSDSKAITSPMITNAFLSRDNAEPLETNVPYGELIGALFSLTCSTRPVLAYTAGVVSRFTAAPPAMHWQVAKRVLRYLQVTVEFGVTYSTRKIVECYSDADYAGDVDGRRSTSDMWAIANGGAVSWRSKLQTVWWLLEHVELRKLLFSETTSEMLWITKLELR